MLCSILERVKSRGWMFYFAISLQLCAWFEFGCHFLILWCCVFVDVELWFGNWKHSPSWIESNKVQQLERAFCNLDYMVGGFEFGW